MSNDAKFRNAAAPVILATVIALGAATVWTFLGFWGEFFYSAFFRTRGSRTELRFTVDGEALKVTYEPTLVPTTVQYRNPNGELHSETAYERPTFRTLDGKPVEYPMILHDSWSLENVMPSAGERSHWGYTRGNIFSYLGAQPPTYWYLVFDRQPQGYAYFVGFDPQTKLRVGYLATRGFSTEPPPLEDQFAIPERLWGIGSREPRQGLPGREPYGSFSDDVYFFSGGEVYRVDFANRSATRVDLPGQAVSLGITSAPRITDEGSSVDYDQRTLFRLEEEIRYVDGRSIPIPEPIRDRNISLISTIGDEVILSGRYYRDSNTELYWVDAEGNVTRHAQIPKEPDRGTGGMEWASVLLVPLPLVSATMLFVAAPLSAVSRGAAADFPTALAATLPNTWLPFAVVCLASLVAAVACYRRHRRYSQQGAIGWALFVLLLGVPGYLGYLWHRTWPARVPCAGCGAVVPRDRPTCLACSVEFPPPVIKGIEMFA